MLKVFESCTRREQSRRFSSHFALLNAPETGFEPVTNRLTGDCSTAELLRNDSRCMKNVAYLASEIKNTLNIEVYRARLSTLVFLRVLVGVIILVSYQIKYMQNRSSNPISSLLTAIIFLVFIGYSLSKANIVSGASLFLWAVLIFVIVVVISGLRIIDQYDRAVVLTLGKYTSTRQPGLTWIMIGFQRMIKIDMRITTTDIPQQEVITKDNVPVGINAVVYFQVQSAENAILNIKDYTLAVSQYAQAALRDVIGGIELDPLLSEREKIAEEIQKIVSAATQSWGILVTDIKIQDIELPADMKRVMAKQAESERERRAIIIRAEGEFQASQKLAQAANILGATHGGLSMRTLQTIEKINPDPSKTVIFALPVEVLEGIKAISQSVRSNKETSH
jgi:regulator of protease activity HflC (stomatin/prohibitin superfamily)